MPHYRVHRIKPGPRESFRWAAHTGGLAIVKARDYDPDEELSAENPYAVWKALNAGGRPLHPGDLLEHVASPDQLPGAGELRIAKYVGFEAAQWYTPEVKPQEAPAPEGVEAAAPSQTPV